MNKIMTFALTSNASALGLNWIYNRSYLERLAKNRSLLFNPVNQQEYEEAKESYLAYPHAKVGDVSAEGDILRWLYQALKENPNLTPKEYENLVFNKIQPGGDYVGFVESYGRLLIYNKIISFHKLNAPKVPQEDDQMIGFMPYIAVKALNLETKKAYELATVFTNKEVYLSYFNWFDEITEALSKQSLQETLKEAVLNAPDEKERFLKATTLNPNELINEGVNTACHIDHALPLIVNILMNTNDLKSALELNVLLGGASSDRASIIGFIYSYISELPNEFSPVHP